MDWGLGGARLGMALLQQSRRGGAAQVEGAVLQQGPSLKPAGSHHHAQCCASVFRVISLVIAETLVVR